jgi:salicylate hydroxylase/6-hydroxynicotinate 3-monooxygenase
MSLIPAELVHHAKKAVGVDLDDDKVRVTFADGTEIIADALIAADGVHSIVREKLLKYTPPTFTGRVAYRTVLALKDIDAPGLDATCKWWGTDRHFVHYRVGNQDELAFTTSVPDPAWDVESWSAVGDPDRLRAEFADFHPDVRSILDAVKTVNIWGIHSRDPLDNWVAGRAVLLGDACHTMPPYMAQGAAMALEDSVVLARCIRAAVDNGSRLEDAFRMYQDARHDRTAAVQKGARANTWGRYGWEADWVFGYDAFNTPLRSAREEIA